MRQAARSHEDAGWMVPGAGVEVGEVVECPVRLGEGEEKAWVLVRALSEVEAQEREGLGLREEYLLESVGLGEPAIRVRRTYDLRAMAEYDFAHSVVDFLLPERQGSGAVVMRRARGLAVEDRVEFLGRMRPPLSDWVWEVISVINRRQPERRAEAEEAKNACGPSASEG